MLVVVYLEDPKKYTVVPESFIYDLDERSLKNRGVNRNQSRLIYFSQACFENMQANENLDEEFEPNFHCPITVVYPLPSNLMETCFIGRTICFEETFENAMMLIDRKRRFLPPIYNAARVLEQPIPSIEPTESEEELIGETTGLNGSSIEQHTIGSEPTEIEEESIGETTGLNDAPTEQHTIGSEEHLQISVPELVVSSSEEDVKPIVDQEDLVAFDNLFSDNRQIASSSENQQTTSSSNDENISSSVLQESFMRSIQFESTRVSSTQANENVVESVADDIEANSTDNQNNQMIDYEPNTDENQNAATFTDDNGDDSQNCDLEAQKKQIEANLREVLLRGQTVVVDHELEYISIPSQQLEAIRCKPTYKTKSNDQLCGNKPFKENGNGDRAFMIATEDSFKEVWLKSQAVDGLIKMNKKKPDEQFDLVFLKALLIGLWTLKAIKDEKSTLDLLGNEGMLDLLKNLFEWRVQKNEDRMDAYENLFSCAINEIRNNNFK